MAPSLVVDATQAEKDATKTTNDDVVITYDRKVYKYYGALGTYNLDLTAYTQWMDDDARDAAILTSSVLL
jgi:hypothetical protein